MKNKFQKIDFFEIESNTLIGAHRKLGKEVRKTVKSILKAKLKIKEKQFVKEIKFLRQCKKTLEKKLVNPKINRKIRRALAKYFNCLTAWGKGAELKKLNHPFIKKLKINNQGISIEDLALWLQRESSSCQTGMVRNKEESIIFWHIEEDAQPKRVVKSQIVTFKIKNKKASFFLYPDLLPGSSFNWQENYFQATDTLHIKKKLAQGSLANIAAWLAWYLIGKIDPKEIISSLSPYIDGYAFIIIKGDKKRATGEVIEFGGSEIIKRTLGCQPNNFLFQTNLVSNHKSHLARYYQKVSIKKMKELQKRLKRAKKMLLFFKTSGHQLNLANVLKIISSHKGGEYAYANHDVKAHVIGQISPKKMELYLGPGSAFKGENLIRVV